MTTKPITFHISRFKTDLIDPPRFYTYPLAVSESMSVLDALEKIRLTREPTLMYRHSCHHSSCGTCACLINGSERLACTTNVWTLDNEAVTVAPLNGFPRIGDLVVDMNPFFKDIDEGWTYLRPSQNRERDPGSDTGDQIFSRFEDCIECGSCVSACPVSRRSPEFMGPAALTAVHREIVKSQKKNRLLKLVRSERGAGLCDRAYECSRVCPTAVYPARHIDELRALE
ncbi:MAG: 2Fe-2S iron-sulfur cluster-binding protein [Thermodesulfobacteriota bacterium]|nr:2Fe-2S iron-sulfur cluster-binding protein [Thermodesulfobacteriota bacterium]